MSNLIRFLIRYQTLILFLFLVTISFLLVVNNSNYQQTKVALTINSFKGGIYNKFANLEDYLNLKAENEKLLEENVSLKNQLGQFLNIDTIRSYEEFNAIRKISYTYTNARVISNSTNKQQNFIILNIGKAQGIRPEMGVISQDGLVGMILNVSENYSSAISVLNNGFNKFSGKLKRSGEYGTISWNGYNCTDVQFSDISQQVNISIGDTVVTNQYSGVFPEGVIIGTISNIRIKDGTFYDIDVKLAQDMRKLNHVYVIDSPDKEEISNLLRNE